MTKLWLKYTDETRKEKRLLVEQEKFAIGRQSNNDLSIADSAISRQHARIERFGDIFVVSDIGSSLGTKLNGEELTEPAALKKGDLLKLGDNFEIEVDLISDSDGADNLAEKEGAEAPKAEDEKKDRNNSGSILASSATSSSNAGGSSIPTSFFYIAPLLGLFVLLGIGGIFFATGDSKGKEKEVAQENDFIYRDGRRNSSAPTPEAGRSVTEETPLLTSESGNSTEIETNTQVVSVTEETNSSPPPKISDESALIEKNSAVFLRKIAGNDPKTFLNGKQQDFIKPLINQYKGSTGLAENIRSIKRNKTQIESLAQSHSLKPLFLANVALAKLGNRSGDVLATAQNMVEILGNLKQNIGAELAEDCLLIVAAYQPSIEGKSSSMIGVLANLTKDSQASARQIRTIWFLKDKDKITNEQFSFALQFLAVGTISQNPKEFGVNAEAINF